MGMYTELNIAVRLKLSDNALEILEFMTGQSDNEDFELPFHPLFMSGTDRWKYMLYCESAYFDHTTCSSLVNQKDFADEDMERVLNVRCDLKNYNDEIENFLDWIYPYSKTKGFIGYMRYEEDGDPTLIYFTNCGVKFRRVNGYETFN